MKSTGTVESTDARLILPPVNAANETAKTRVFREAKARKTAELILGQLFAWLKANIGVEDAWRDFNSWTERSRPKSLSGHRGPSDYRQGTYLLGVYDRLAEQTNGETGLLPKWIAVVLHRTEPGKYGNSADAIARKIRRLLEEREARRAGEAELHAAQQELIDELGWSAPKSSMRKRGRNTSVKSRDK